MIIEVKGSYEILRGFCQGVRHFIKEELSNTDIGENDLMEIMYCMIIPAEAIHYKIPLEHLMIESEDSLDDEMVEWIKNKPAYLIEMVLIHFAELIMETEITKRKKRLSA